MSHFRRLIAVAFIIVTLLGLSSCTTKRVEVPDVTGLTLDDALVEYNRIKAIEAVMALEYERKDTIMSGDASLAVSPEKLNLRIYYLGFLQGEVTEEKGEIVSKPRLDRTKSRILVEGLKKGFFWWDMEAPARTETPDTFELTTPGRKVVVSKTTLLPIEQTILFENGDRLAIWYDMPKRMEEPAGDNASALRWYPSHLVITLKNYTVRADISSYAVSR